MKRLLLIALLTATTAQAANLVDREIEMRKMGQIASSVSTINSNSRLFATVIISDFIFQAADKYHIEVTTGIQRTPVIDIVHYSAIGQMGNLIAFQIMIAQAVLDYDQDVN